MEEKKNGFNPKRIAALIGIILLVGMYVVLLIEAIVGAPGTGDVFLMCLAATVAVPILVWVFIWIYGIVTKTHTIASLDAMTSDKQHDKDGRVVAGGKIKTVVFDIGNVLVDFSWKDRLRGLGYDENMVERIGKATTYSSDWNEFDRGVLTTEQILDRFIKNDPEIADDIKKAFCTLEGVITKRERSIPWIESLKAAGYKVLVLSNFSIQALDSNRDAMDFLENVDGGILSYKEKVIKPDPAIYKLLEKRYDLIPEETVFIDDTKPNIEACKKLGWNGIVYKDYGQVKTDLNNLGVVY